MINTIIFDLGNVVWRYQEKLDQLKNCWAEISGITPDNFRHLYHGFYKKLETNENTLDDFINSLQQSANHHLFKQAIDQIYLAPDFESYLNAETIEIINQLHQKYTVGYLSNGENYQYPYFQKRMEQYFDWGHCSWQLGIRKPDPEIFKKVLSLHNLIAEETLFIDDVAKNIHGAQFVGLQTIHFIDPQQLLSQLQQLNIIH